MLVQTKIPDMAKETTQMRLDPELKRKGHIIASWDRRTFTSLVEYLLEQEIRRREKQGFDFNVES